MSKSSVKNQYFAAICANILTLSYGLMCGWPSSSFLILQSDDSPLESGPMTNEQASWVSSIMCLGGILGNFLFSWFANIFGRKISMILIVIPMSLNWVLIIVATNVDHLLISRFMGGIAGGGIFCLIPLYVTEISEDKVRGVLGSLLVLSCNFGILLAFVCALFIDYQTFPYVASIPLIVFLVLFVFLPETPPHLLKSKKIKEAESSLRYFRNLKKVSKEPSEYFQDELQRLKHDYLDEPKDSKEENSSVTWSDFTTKPALKALIIGITLMALSQFCGCFAMLSYTATIFTKAGSTLSANVSAVIVGAIQQIGSHFASAFVEKAGRKILISGSAIGTGLGLVVMGMYLQLDQNPDYDVSAYRWIPLASFSFVMFTGSMGVLSLPFVVISEVSPPKIRGAIVGISMTLLWFFAFLVIKYLIELIDLLCMHGAIYLFATCSFAGAIFVLAYIPETKGRSIDEIMMMME